ncbi:MAG: hypothetical protein MUC39_02105 [Candidatus Omnitrophica bacterium]|jgi:hypothetical protein|nr:hypothetical protein [Candidatus Omnitrophota bacterium]
MPKNIIIALTAGFIILALAFASVLRYFNRRDAVSLRQARQLEQEKEEAEFNQAKLLEELKKQKYDVIAFESALATVELPASEKYADQEKIMKQLKSGEVSVYAASDAINATKIQCEKAQKEIMFIRVPAALPKTTQKQLEEVKTDIAAGYAKKTVALDYLLKFLDDGKPLYERKFNESLKDARQFSTSAALSLLEVKKKVGFEF